jgi:hypothetical protein
MKKFTPLLLLVITIISPSCNLYCQDLNFPGISPSISATVILNSRLDLNLLTTSKIRTGDHTIKGLRYPSHLLQNYTLAILSYKLNRHWQAGGGCGFEVNDPFLDTWRTNQRLIQQVQYTITGTKTRFTNRLRFEERWFRYHHDPPAFGTRGRYQIGFNQKLNAKGVYWQITNELYATTSGPRNALISEDWLYSCIGLPITALSHFEAGIGFDSTVRDTEHDLNNLFMLQFQWNFVIGSSHKKERVTPAAPK